MIIEIHTIEVNGMTGAKKLVRSFGLGTKKCTEISPRGTVTCLGQIIISNRDIMVMPKSMSPFNTGFILSNSRLAE